MKTIDIDYSVDISLSPEQICFLIVKAREFDVKDVATDDVSGSNASDDGMAAVLEDRGDDPVVEEITDFINAMSVDKQIDLVALTWLGRGNYSAEEWDEAREEAARAHNARTAAYLLGTPLLADYLEEGYSMLGHSCEDVEIDRL